MAHRRSTIGDGLFWGMTGALFAAIMGGAIGYVFARFYGAGWISGGALGIVIFLIGSLILARSSANLPPPNTLKSPVAPPGGAFRAPDAPPHSPRTNRPPPPAETAPSRDAPPQSVAEMGHAAGEAVGKAASGASAAVTSAAQSVADMGHSAGEAIGKAAYSASAAVTSAAQAAKAAIGDVLEPSKPDAAPDARAAEPSTPAAATDEPAPTAEREPLPLSEQVRPEALPGPRESGPDDLKRIRGVGPKLEEMLNSRGIYHFDQIAAWGPGEIAWVDSNIEGFHGRASRDDWIGQSKILAAGGETEHSRRVDRGEST